MREGGIAPSTPCMIWCVSVLSLCLLWPLQVSPGVFEYIPSPVDEGIKVAVIRDTLRLVDPRKKKKKQKDETWP